MQQKELAPVSESKSGAYDQLVLNSPYFAYVLAHANQEKVAIIPSTGAIKKAESYSNPLLAASAVSASVSNVGSIANIGFVTGAVAFDMLKWLVQDTAEEKKQALAKHEQGKLKQPGLWVVRLQPPQHQADDKTLDTLFMDAQAELLRWPLKCDQSFYRGTNPFGSRFPRGEFVSAQYHSRGFICGYEDLDLSMPVIIDEKVSVVTQKLEDGNWLTHIQFPLLNVRKGLHAVLGLSANDAKYAGKHLYELLKPQFSEDTYAVFTMPNATGEWKVFVSRGNQGTPVEFELR